MLVTIKRKNSQLRNLMKDSLQGGCDIRRASTRNIDAYELSHQKDRPNLQTICSGSVGLLCQLCIAEGFSRGFCTLEFRSCLVTVLAYEFRIQRHPCTEREQPEEKTADSFGWHRRWSIYIRRWDASWWGKYSWDGKEKLDEEENESSHE